MHLSGAEPSQHRCNQLSFERYSPAYRSTSPSYTPHNFFCSM